MDAASDQLILGRALRELREQAGITQSDLAARVGTTDTYVSLIENGHRGLRWHTVMRVLRALGADLHDLADAIDRAD
jgi:transcriptional regulator with XRE-family HTH domain